MRSSLLTLTAMAAYGFLPVLAAYGFHQREMFLAEQRAISAAAGAYEQGRKDALSLDEPVHNDLEMACLTLWISEQNLLYMQKNPTE